MVPAVDTMVGLTLNTIPIRVQLRPSASMPDLLRRMFADQSAMIPHHHLGLGEIGRATGLATLFDTLLVFRNTGGDAERFDVFERVGITAAEATDATQLRGDPRRRPTGPQWLDGGHDRESSGPDRRRHSGDVVQHNDRNAGRRQWTLRRRALRRWARR